MSWLPDKIRTRQDESYFGTLTKWSLEDLIDGVWKLESARSWAKKAHPQISERLAPLIGQLATLAHELSKETTAPEGWEHDEKGMRMTPPSPDMKMVRGEWVPRKRK